MQEETKNTAAEQENVQTVEVEQEKQKTSAEESKTAQQAQEKTFTQSELDKIISDRLARERKNLPDDKSLNEFKEWKKSQQTEAEKQAEREKEYQQLQSTAETLKRENMAIKAGVSADDLDYVLFKVGKLDGEFDKNLALFLSENKKYTEPKTKSVAGTSHTQAAKPAITKAQFDKMGYQDRAKLKTQDPDLYAQLKGDR